MLRIGFDASPLIRPMGGIGWHTFHLFRALLAIDGPQLELVGYLPSNSRPQEDYSDWLKSGKLKWRTKTKLSQWFNATEPGLDLFHGPNFKMPIQGRYGGVITIHDLWLDRYPQYSKKLFGQMPSFFRTRRRAWAAKRVIAVSQCTAADVGEFYGLPEDRIVVIPNGVSEEFFAEDSLELCSHIASTYNLPTSKYFLFVGGANPRKNHKTLLNALAQCPEILKDHCLVVVGGMRGESEVIMDNARNYGIGDRVVYAGRVSVVELRRLYKGAELFVFPSLYEGFGIPLLEAMACSAPIITSYSSALPEVAGDAAVFVDPQDETSIVRAIRKLIDNPPLRESLKRKGLLRVESYKWKHSAKKTLELYATLCA